MNTPSLSQTLRWQKKAGGKDTEERAPRALKGRIEGLQLQLLKIQQGVWHRKARAILVFEGFDASGKGGCIRQLTEGLDPRGALVYPIGPPTAIEQGTHWLSRFWKRLPAPGTLAIFDRSWYGRLLVERVEKLTPKPAWRRAYREIREFERMLTDDGVEIVKFFLAVSPEEQLRRFRERLENPAKRWKLTMADIQAREHWDDYIEAADDLLRLTRARHAPWHVIPSDDKSRAQRRVLEIAAHHFRDHRNWLEATSDETRLNSKEIHKALRKLEKAKR
jgi:AMP-polyphosphate phosphotransferase